MVKVIEEGKSKFQATCDRCLCVFEYELSDLVKYISCEYVKCPHCKHEIHHSPSKDNSKIPGRPSNLDDVSPGVEVVTLPYKVSNK